jgi:preprotein translocase subunit YajC
MQNALSEGDVVTTTSGLRGTIVDASYEDTIDLEIADGVVTTWLRAAIRDKVATDTHVDDEAAASDTPTELPSTPTTSTNGTSPDVSDTAKDATVESPADEKK